MRDRAYLCFIEEQAEGMSPCYRLDAVMHPQFLKDMGHMTFDSVQGDHQLSGDLLVRVATSHQLEHLQFAFGKRVDEWLLHKVTSRRVHPSRRLVCRTPR